MAHVTRIDRNKAGIPEIFRDYSHGFTRQKLIGRDQGSTHMLLSACWIDADGFIAPVVHSFEFSIYVLDGELEVFMQGEKLILGKDYCLIVPIGTTYSISSATGANWLQCNAPGEVKYPRRKDTYFTGEKIANVKRVEQDLRDPRNQHSFRFDATSMNLGNLAVGSKVNAPSVSASMATALLAYSGIGVRMLVDQRLGAKLHTMFMVDYQPSAIAHPHDHPFEEAYVFVEGEVHGLIEGEELVLNPGDVLWAGVGADHGFHHRGEGLVRWIEYQAPQPPTQHSYRFTRDWEYLDQKLTSGQE